MAKLRKGSDPSRPMGTSAEYEERLGIRMARPKKNRRVLFAQVTLYALLLSTVLTAVFSMIYTPKMISAHREVSQMMEANYNPAFRTRYEDLGKTIIELWYSKERTQSPIAVSKNVTWQGNLEKGTAPVSITNITLFHGSIEPAGNMFIETLTYRVMRNGVPFNITVTLVVPSISPDSTQSPVLLSAPSISSVDFVTSPDIVSVAVPPNMGQPVGNDSTMRMQLEMWAQAWTSNDSLALKRVTGDSSADRQYVGMYTGTWEYVENSVVVQFFNWTTEQSKTDAYARISWTMRSAPVEALDAKGEVVEIPGASQTQTMDLLVLDAGTALPRIVDWVDVGRYSDLREFGQALSPSEHQTIQQLSGKGVAEQIPDDATADEQPTDYAPVDDVDAVPETPEQSGE